MEEKAQILIIDDDPVIREMLLLMVRQLGYYGIAVETLRDGFKQLEDGHHEIVLLDVMLPDGDGLGALPEILSTPSSPQVLIMTAAGNINGAELALRSGAWDYLCKPVPLGEFALQIQRALQYRQANKANRNPVALKRSRIVGESPQMHQCLDMLARASGSSANVLINGETGVGKEVIA